METQTPIPQWGGGHPLPTPHRFDCRAYIRRSHLGALDSRLRRSITGCLLWKSGYGPV